MKYACEYLNYVKDKIIKKEISVKEILETGGVISRADYFRERIRYINDDTLQSNLSYHLMLSEVLTWMMTRFNFYATIKEMLIKISIANIGNIIESIVLYITKQNKKKQM